MFSDFEKYGVEKLEKETPYRAVFVCEASDKDAEQKMKPRKKGQAGMCLAGKIYMLSEDPAYMASVADDPVKTLDVSVLQDTVLSPILGIGDPRTDKRIKFVGGIRGVSPLIDAAGDDSASGVSFAMYPTSMSELFAVADAGLLMPPKSTWFEPKLRSGLFIHEI